MLYFVGSTFISKIVMLNMLIAIMTKTFKRHNEDLDYNARRQKLALQSEYVKLVNFYARICCCCNKNKSSKPQSGYLYVVTPRVSTDEDGVDDQGDMKEDNDVKSMSNSLSERFTELDDILNKQVMPGIMSLQEDTSARLDAI